MITCIACRQAAAAPKAAVHVLMHKAMQGCACRDCCRPDSALHVVPAGPGRNNLLRRAGAAFDKFGKVLEVSPLGQGLATPLGKDIASVLLKVLLPNQAYCQRATVEAFQGVAWL